MTENQLGNLEELALKRKEKLQSLKRKRDEDKNDEMKQFGDNPALPKPKFRSYKPADEKLGEHVLPNAKPGDVEKEVTDQLNSANVPIVIDDLDITSLAPRKPDWDLKRDVAKRLAKLEKRTQKAIAELIRIRLKERKSITSS